MKKLKNTSFPSPHQGPTIPSNYTLKIYNINGETKTTSFPSPHQGPTIPSKYTLTIYYIN